MPVVFRLILVRRTYLLYRHCRRGSSARRGGSFGFEVPDTVAAIIFFLNISYSSIVTSPLSRMRRSSSSENDAPIRWSLDFRELKTYLTISRSTKPASNSPPNHNMFFQNSRSPGIWRRKHWVAIASSIITPSNASNPARPIQHWFTLQIVDAHGNDCQP